MSAIIEVMAPKVFVYDYILEAFSNYLNEKSTVAVKQIEGGFSIEYQYESFVDESKYAVKIKLFQDFIVDNIQDMIPVEVYLCYTGMIEDINNVSKTMYKNIGAQPKIKVHTFDEIKVNLPSFN